MSNETYARLTTHKAKSRAQLVGWIENVLMVAIAFAVGFAAICVVYGTEVLLGVA